MNSNLDRWLDADVENLLTFSKRELAEQLLIAIEIIRAKNKILERYT